MRLANSSTADTIVEYFFSNKLVQRDSLDSSGSLSTSHPKTQPLEVELVTGKKEELYWSKVPERIRMQALAKATASAREQGAIPQSVAAEEGKKPKRRKRA